MEIRTLFGTATLLAFIGAGLSITLAPASGEAQEGQAPKDFSNLAPARGYLEAHKDVQQPGGLLGGPIKVTINQKGGLVFVALPDNRKLDPNVFGTPELPRAYGGTPGINGVPPMARGVKDGQYTQLKKKTPFGDKYTTMDAGLLQIQGWDATATDAAVTEDRVRMTASWSDQKGNTYTVKCCVKMAAHGVEFPTFGGVVTNHILHGFTRIGTALMPSEFTYFAFWGMGEVSKNGEVLAKPRLVHGMLTEYVRGQGYALAFDEGVDPTHLHFHLMVPPMKPVPEEGRFAHDPVDTGFTLPNGKTLPFWHVMFEQLEFSASRGEA